MGIVVHGPYSGFLYTDPAPQLFQINVPFWKWVKEMCQIQSLAESLAYCLEMLNFPRLALYPSLMQKKWLP